MGREQLFSVQIPPDSAKSSKKEPRCSRASVEGWLDGTVQIPVALSWKAN